MQVCESDHNGLVIAFPESLLILLVHQGILGG